MRHLSPPRPAFYFAALLFAPAIGSANNIQVSNTTLVGNTGTSVQVEFNLSWENSWRGGGVTNWDAAWVFAKYRTTTGAWQHIPLTSTGHIVPSGTQVDLGLLTPDAPYNVSSNPVLGVFIRRDADGNGTMNLPGVKLRWDYWLTGLAYNDIAEVRVYAIEMVYVNQGAFAAGSGGSESFGFTLTTINTAAANSTPGGTGSLGGEAGGYPTGQTAPNFKWPNGFSAFYCMKYELSQQGYVDFLNTLTYAQQVTRTETPPNSSAGSGALITPAGMASAFRNGIDIQTSGVATATPASYACNLDADANYGEPGDGKDIACNFLIWNDLIAYLDWSGLRPMSELEFEKACRGILSPVPNEYPWATAQATVGDYGLSSSGNNNEGIPAGAYSTSVGNANYGGTSGVLGGPVRVGIFAANAGNTGRVTSGSTYYGIMEMGGNVAEKAVHMSDEIARAYTGVHGNGGLTPVGENDVELWPYTHHGNGLRGGYWNCPAVRMCVSDRNLGAASFLNRNDIQGGRGVRTAP